MQQNVNKLLNLEYLIKLKKTGDEQVKIALKTALCCMIIEQERSCDKKRPFQKVNQTLYLLIKQNGIYFVSFYKTSPSHVTQIIFSHINVIFGYSKVSIA